MAETIGERSEVMKSMHILSLDHFSSVIFRHDIVYLQLQGRIVNSLYHISRLKLISPIASHGQGDRPYQMLRSCQYAVLSPEASQIVYLFFKRLSDVKLKGRRLALCLILRAGRQSQRQPVIPVRSAEAVPASIMCHRGIIWRSLLDGIPVS